MKSSIRLVFLSLCVVFGMSGVAPVQGADHPYRFSFRLRGDPGTLDWNRAQTAIEGAILLNLMEGLVTYNDEMQVVPALAQKWKVSPDGRTYTFTLRPGVKWSDGVALKAEDFLTSWKRLLSPGTGAAYAYLLFDIEGAEEFFKGHIQDFSAVGVKALNPGTIQVRLRQPVANWIQILTLWSTFPLRADILEKNPSSWDRLGKLGEPGKMVTLGPFTLEQQELNHRITLKANPLYYGPHGNIQEVVALIADDSTAVNLYETGHLDFLPELSSMDIKRFRGRSDLQIFRSFKTGYLGFVTQRSSVADVHVRKAIAMAIDRSKIPEIFFGSQTAATSFIPPGVLGYLPQAGLPFSPKRAKAELKMAGVDPKYLKIDLLIRSGDKQQLIAEYIQAQLKKNLGIQLGVQSFDAKSFRSSVNAGVFPLFENSWTADYPDPDNFLSMFVTGSGTNRTGWNDPKFDQLILSARYSGNKQARQRAYAEAQDLLLKKAVALVPLYHDANTALLKSRVKNLRLSPLGHLYLRGVSVSKTSK